jgi:hypothetical protein
MRKMWGIRSAVLRRGLPEGRNEGGEVVQSSGACTKGRWVV